MTPNDELVAPEATWKDHATLIGKTVMKTGVQFLTAGLAPADLIEFIKPPLQKRTEEFLKQVCEYINRHAAQLEKLQIENLSEDPGFQSIVIQAMIIAARTHREEKRTALRNAVINTALCNRPEDDLREIFLNLIDIFTPWHLRLLAFFERPEKIMADRGVLAKYTGRVDTTLLTHLAYTYPELKDEQHFVGLIIKDLVDRRLVHDTYFRQHAKHTTLMAGCILPIGTKFLKFISDPLLQEKE